MWGVSHREGNEVSAQRAEAQGPKDREWGWVLGEVGSEPLPHQLGGLWSAVSSSIGVWDGAPENLKFGAT